MSVMDSIRDAGMAISETLMPYVSQGSDMTCEWMNRVVVVLGKAGSATVVAEAVAGCITTVVGLKMLFCPSSKTSIDPSRVQQPVKVSSGSEDDSMIHESAGCPLATAHLSSQEGSSLQVDESSSMVKSDNPAQQSALTQAVDLDSNHAAVESREQQDGSAVNFSPAVSEKNVADSQEKVPAKDARRTWLQTAGSVISLFSRVITSSLVVTAGIVTMADAYFRAQNLSNKS